MHACMRAGRWLLICCTMTPPVVQGPFSHISSVLFLASLATCTRRRRRGYGLQYGRYCTRQETPPSSQKQSPFWDPLIGPGSKSWLGYLALIPQWHGHTEDGTRKDPADLGPTLKSSSRLTGLANSCLLYSLRYLLWRRRSWKDNHGPSGCVDRRAESSSRPLGTLKLSGFFFPIQNSLSMGPLTVLDNHAHTHTRGDQDLGSLTSSKGGSRGYWG